jgi:hypothetical protein
MPKFRTARSGLTAQAQEERALLYDNVRKVLAELIKSKDKKDAWGGVKAMREAMNHDRPLDNHVMNIRLFQAVRKRLTTEEQDVANETRRSIGNCRSADQLRRRKAAALVRAQKAELSARTQAEAYQRDLAAALVEIGALKSLLRERNGEAASVRPLVVPSKLLVPPPSPASLDSAYDDEDDPNPVEQAMLHQQLHDFASAPHPVPHPSGAAFGEPLPGSVPPVLLAQMKHM